jgi:predicted nucleic acid-binding protein
VTVVDASVVVRLLLAGRSDELLRQRIASAERSLHAPAHLDIEVLSAISGLLKASKLAKDRAQRMVEHYESLRVQRHPIAPLSRRILDLRNNFTAYDAAYLALAPGSVSGFLPPSPA